MEMMYRKVGRKYVPFKPFEGFPANGIWLVKRDGNSQTLTIYLDDLHMTDMNVVVELSRKYDKLVDYLVDIKFKNIQLTSFEQAQQIIKVLSSID